jgi:ATP-binding cassette subfamily B (MDR/TAP) protein 1
LCVVNVGTVITVLLSIMIGSFSLAMLAPEVAAVTSAMGAAAKLFATIDRVPAIDSADPGGLKPEKAAGEIELKDVRFHYPTRPEVEVLKGVSLVFKAGETIALVGASGCGKNTTVALIERFYDPSGGSVALDGTDIKPRLTGARPLLHVHSRQCRARTHRHSPRT